MRTLLLTFVCALCACSGPERGADTGSEPQPSPDGGGNAADTSASPGDGDDASPGTTTPDASSTTTPDTSSSPTPDASSLPTACVNDCLCESSCDHRCNITCRSECASGTCNFELNAGGYVTCRAGSTCDVSCESGGCEVLCEPGATCSITCGPQAVACFFKECGGTEQTCSSRRKTCDAAC